jgi:hypothetical protein
MENWGDISMAELKVIARKDPEFPAALTFFENRSWRSSPQSDVPGMSSSDCSIWPKNCGKEK